MDKPQVIGVSWADRFKPKPLREPGAAVAGCRRRVLHVAPRPEIVLSHVAAR
jgi:hypothetical protein